MGYICGTLQLGCRAFLFIIWRSIAKSMGAAGRIVGIFLLGLRNIGYVCEVYLGSLWIFVIQVGALDYSYVGLTFLGGSMGL